VSNSDFLRLAANARRKQRGEPELEPLEFYGFVMPKVPIASPAMIWNSLDSKGQLTPTVGHMHNVIITRFSCLEARCVCR
jgi:hypothetical protein